MALGFSWRYFQYLKKKKKSHTPPKLSSKPTEESILEYRLEANLTRWSAACGMFILSVLNQVSIHVFIFAPFSSKNLSTHQKLLSSEIQLAHYLEYTPWVSAHWLKNASRLKVASLPLPLFHFTLVSTLWDGCSLPTLPHFTDEKSKARGG